MPRPKTFDPDEAIQAAMMVFWKKGYEGTSYEDLVKETGVNRTSLYNSFGDKRAMFLKVLDVYHTTIKVDLLKEISKPDSGLKDLIGFLEHVIEMFQIPSDKPKGCLFCNAHNELMPSDDIDINTKMTVLLDQPALAVQQ